MTPKYITNQREMTMKKHRFRCRNGQKRTPSTELRNCMKTRSFLSFRCCVAQKTNFQIIQSHREFIPNARREAGQFGVYQYVFFFVVPSGFYYVLLGGSRVRQSKNQKTITRRTSPTRACACFATPPRTSRYRPTHLAPTTPVTRCISAHPAPTRVGPPASTPPAATCPAV